jgi:hypothetical protein
VIIDLRTQAPIPGHAPDHSSEPAEEGELSEGPFDEAMACVGVAAVIATRCERLGVEPNNEAVAAFVARAPEKRIGFAAIDPLQPSAFEDLERAIERGFAGVTLAPADHGYRPTHDGAQAVLARCAESGLPVLVANPLLRHPGSQLDFASPALLDEIVRDLPNLTVILGDFGRIFLEETLLMVAKHPRVFAEISGAVNRPWTLYTAMIAAHERGVLHKLLFGSGFPVETPEAAIERIYTINAMRGGTDLPSVPRESLRSIVERNALACIGIEAPAAERTAPEKPAPRLTAGAESA